MFVFKSFILDLLFPMFCFGCNKEGSLLCDACVPALRVVPPQCFVCGKLAPSPVGRTCVSCCKKSHIFGFLSPFMYQQEIVRMMIHAFKYEGMKSLAPFFAEHIFCYLQKYGALPTATLFIPIPLRARRRRARGFNQAELIAVRLGKLTGISVDTTILKKVKDTVPQASLSAQDRRCNLEGSFQISARAEIKRKTIILVDDVKTTGVTLEEAARVLKKAGAKEIWAITIAH